MNGRLLKEDEIRELFESGKIPEVASIIGLDQNGFYIACYYKEGDPHDPNHTMVYECTSPLGSSCRTETKTICVAN